MSPRPLVSVVMATRNRQQLVATAVASALRQDYTELEVLVVDDRSEPPVAEEALPRDERVRLLRLQDAAGVGAARNLGIREARGSLVAFLDDDDAWRPDALGRLVDALMASGAETAAAECGYDLWQDGRVTFRYVPRPDRDLLRTLLERPALQPSTVLVRRAVLEELDGFDNSLPRTEDWELWIRLAERYAVAVVPAVLVDREAGYSPVSEEMLVGYVELVRRLEPRIAALPPRDRRRVLATHAFVEGLLQGSLGRPTEARRAFRTALRRDPTRWLALAHLLRTVVGERPWHAARAVWRLGRMVGLRAAGRDPLVRRW
jgi:glycosyltransferase involved in cell wall biosynthesis